MDSVPPHTAKLKKISCYICGSWLDGAQHCLHWQSWSLQGLNFSTVLQNRRFRNNLCLNKTPFNQQKVNRRFDGIYHFRFHMLMWTQMLIVKELGFRPACTGRLLPHRAWCLGSADLTLTAEIQQPEMLLEWITTYFSIQKLLLTGHGGPGNSETSRFPQFPESPLRYVGKFVSLARWQHFTPLKIPDNHYSWRLSWTEVHNAFGIIWLI
jgi:hypothetical protein